MVDTRLVKQPLPQCTPQAMCMTGAETTVVVPPPHYYDARNDDPAPAHKASNMVWAVDPTTNQAVSEVGNVDLKRGAKDDNTLFDWVSDLQHDLWDFGYRAHLANKGTGAIPASFEATGEFDDRLERVVRRFQIHATLNTRKTRGGGPMSVPSQFKGEVNGIVDDETKREIARWVAAGYVRVLQPFDPERILSTQFAAGHINPEFYTLLTETLVARADEQDLELYGATTRSADPDGFREHHPYSTWHLVGLGCDLNSYSTKVVGAPWYDPRGEYDAWPIWEWERYRTMVKAVGLLISFPPSKDPRHVEFHPLVVHPDDPTRWTSVPRSIRDFISNSGPNSNANIRRAWGIAVNTRYAASELAPLTSPRPRPRPARPSGD